MKDKTPVPLTFGELFSWCIALGGKFLQIDTSTFKFFVEDSIYVWTDGTSYRL